MSNSTNDNGIAVIKFGKEGKAPILNYDIPEPTTYSGRNFISLQLPSGTLFKYKIPNVQISSESKTKEGVLPTAQNPLLVKVTAAMANGFADDEVFPNLKLNGGILRLVTKATDPPIREVVSPEAISPKLKDLKPEEVAVMIYQGLRLNVYKALNGALTYNYIPHDFRSFGVTRKTLPTFVTADVVPLESQRVFFDKFNGGPNPSATGDPPRIEISVEGHAVDGFVDFPQGIRTAFSLQRVELRLERERAVPAGQNATWKGSVFVSGNAGETKDVTITATAFYKGIPVGGRGDEIKTFYSKSTIVRVHFLGDGGGGQVDRTPPILIITSPVDGEEFLDSGTGVNFDLTGTAEDPPDGAGGASGMDRVQVKLDNDTIIRAESTDPNMPWKSWKAHIELAHEATSRSHSISAVAYDRANNLKPASITIKVNTQITTPILTTLLLVESYKLSSFLGDFGLGRTVKTFSLLPGEKTKISIRTFTRSDETRKISSSILDSVSNESSDDFENSILSEQSNKQNFQETENFKIDAHADAGWGFGSASVNTAYSNETNAAREDFSKNVTNGVKKHASKASASRDMEVNTSYETQVVTEEETSIEREIENINLSRTLNFVFRQLNQAFYTFLHLVDVKVAFYKNDGINPPLYVEESLPFLDRFLGDYIQEGDRQKIREAILDQLQNIIDYEGRIHDDFVTEEPFKDKNGSLREDLKYLRVNKSKVMSYKDPAVEGQREFKLEGIIIGVTKNVIRTEGIIAEALLGQANALDKYSSSLQIQAIREKSLDNDLTQSEIDKKKLGIKIIEDGNTAQGEIFEQVFPCCKPQVFSLWPPKDEEENSDEENS